MHAVTTAQLDERRAGVVLFEDRDVCVSVKRDFRIVGASFRPFRPGNPQSQLARISGATSIRSALRIEHLFGNLLLGARNRFSCCVRIRLLEP